jgi:uncharacterized protein
MMAVQDRFILASLAARVRSSFPTAEIRAFGSRARGTAEPDSDMDICVVLSKVDREALGIVRQAAWEIGFENNRVITTIVLDDRQFRSGPLSESGLVAAIHRDGVAG